MNHDDAHLVADVCKELTKQKHDIQSQLKELEERCRELEETSVKEMGRIIALVATNTALTARVKELEDLCNHGLLKIAKQQSKIEFLTAALMQ